jgi:DNA-binding NarL/FixJ family response regulator
MMRLYIVHTQPVIEESLRITMGRDPEIEIVGSQVDTELIEDRVLTSHASVLLLDGSAEVERLTQIIRRLRTVVKVVVLVEQDEPDLLLSCVRAGAIGYLSGPRRFGEIASALRRVHDGWAILTGDQVATLVSGPSVATLDRDAVELCASLSGRERDVLRSLAAGDSLGETANRLKISVSTVQTHLKNVMRKLNARSRVAAAVLAARAGILREPDHESGTRTV